MSNFKIGDRVTATRPYYNWGYVSRGDIGTIVQGPDSSRDYRIDFPKQKNWTGREGEFELIAKGEYVKPFQRKTYKQLKDSVTVKKGALWQEACDDGDQEYVLLDSAFNRDPRQTQRIYDRSLVEDDPKNFVEVFKVDPEYQTREELDQWEAFKKVTAKPAGRKTPGAKLETIKATRGRKTKKAA